MNARTVWTAALVWAGLSWVAFGAPPANYYNTAEGLSGTSLRNALHDIIDNHTAIPYSGGTYDARRACEDLDENPANASQVIMIYSSKAVAKSTWPNWNREHVWPQSYGVSSGKANSDMHHLFACNAVTNSTRGNKFFDNGGTSAPPEAPDCRYDSDSFQVAQQWRGDVARAILYMDVRYDGSEGNADLVCTDNTSLITTGNARYMGKLSTLLAWHTQDPVDAAERERNDGVFAIQGNRNPFIDRPEFVSAVFGGGTTPPPPPPPPSGGGTLTNGVTTSNIVVAQGAWVHYTISVPSNATSFKADMTGTGDADLYVRSGAQPTSSAYDARPYLSGSAESATISGSALRPGTTYYVSAYGYTAATITLKATITTGTTPPPPPSGFTPVTLVNVSNVSVSASSWRNYNVVIPAGCTRLVVTMSGSGDADLYVRRGSLPTLSAYDFRPYLDGSAESVTVTSPTVGSTYYISAYGYVASTINLTVRAE